MSAAYLGPLKDSALLTVFFFFPSPCNIHLQAENKMNFNFFGVGRCCSFKNVRVNKWKKKSFKIVAPFFFTKLKCSYWIWWITYLSLSWHFVYPSWTYLAAILGVQKRSIDITRHFVDCIQNVTVLVNCLAFLPQTLFIPNHPHPWTPPPAPPRLPFVSSLYFSSLVSSLTDQN